MRFSKANTWTDRIVSPQAARQRASQAIRQRAVSLSTHMSVSVDLYFPTIYFKTTAVLL